MGERRKVEESLGAPPTAPQPNRGTSPALPSHPKTHSGERIHGAGERQEDNLPLSRCPTATRLSVPSPAASASPCWRCGAQPVPPHPCPCSAARRAAWPRIATKRGGSMSASNAARCKHSSRERLWRRAQPTSDEAGAGCQQSRGRHVRSYVPHRLGKTGLTGQAALRLGRKAHGNESMTHKSLTSSPARLPPAVSLAYSSVFLSTPCIPLVQTQRRELQQRRKNLKFKSAPVLRMLAALTHMARNSSTFALPPWSSCTANSCFCESPPLSALSVKTTDPEPGWTTWLRKGRGMDQTEMGLRTFVHPKHLHKTHLLCFYLSLHLHVCKGALQVKY